MKYTIDVDVKCVYLRQCRPNDIKWSFKKDNSYMKTRSSNTMSLVEPGKTNVLCATFMSDAARLWNNRLAHLNDKIDKSWLEQSIDTFKVKCKQLFLQNN